MGTVMLGVLAPVSAPLTSMASNEPFVRTPSLTMEEIQRILDGPLQSSAAEEPPPAVNKFRRMPSGNSFATMPCALERVGSGLCALERTGSGLDRTGSGNLTRVPSGLAELTFTLSQLHDEEATSSEALAESGAAPQPSASQRQEIESCAMGWVYDMATLDRCSSGEQAAASVASLPEAPSQVVGNNAALLGPWGPYNPAPTWVQGCVAEKEMRAPDEFEGKQVVMVRGKYRGRNAFVQRKVNKKYRLQVEGVAWGLEFFPNMFALPRAGPMLTRC